MNFFVLLSTNTTKMDGECLNLIALRYHRAKNYDIAKTYYLLAIEHGNTNAMNNLGYYYEIAEKNYELMKKYYLMAIDCGNTITMNNLGYYYHFVEKDYDEMKKYYLMAIEYGHTASMTNLGQYYYTIEINAELSKKYLLMAYPLPIAMDHLRALAKYNLEIFNDELKTKSITLEQLCSIYKNTAKLLEQLEMIYTKHEYPYALQLIDELTQKIFGTLCIAECPICTETIECGHYPCDERHIICRDCYWQSPEKCYYNCSK